MIFTTAPVSPPWTVNQADLERWGHNLLIFLIPLALIYLSQLQGSLQVGSLTFKSLIPTPITQGAIELYVVNGITDLLKKFSDATK